ncbi:MAG: 4Fe-4S dicluster domain-containing protein [Thermodesulfobacteriota bacterium]
MASDPLEVKEDEARSLIKEVMERSGQNLAACYQCRRCAAGCPVGEETGYVTPDRLIRMVTLGDRENALNNELVWKCVSCYTCGARCPNDIQTARITETLKKMSKEAHLEPLNSKVAEFHHAFLQSSLRWGRVNEMEFMGLYEMKNALNSLKRKDFKAIAAELKEQGNLGLSMFKLKRMHFGLQTSKGRKEIERLRKKISKTRGK